MSTDYDVVCDHCKTYTHLGQRFSSGYAFGFSSHDKEGQDFAFQFIEDHIRHGVRVRSMHDILPEDYFYLQNTNDT